MSIVSFLLLCWSFSYVVGASYNCTAPYSLITFDDLPATTSSVLVPSGYFGLNWSNVYYTYVYSWPSQSGYNTALSSGSYDILNGYENPMTISSTPTTVFNISSFIAAAAWNDNLLLSIIGQRNGTTVYQQTITLQVTTSLVVVLNWTRIDTISFTTSGGTLNSMFNGTYYGGIHLGMDNLCADVSSFYTTTTGVQATSTASSGSGGNGGGDGGGDGDGIDIEINGRFGKKPGIGLTIGGLPLPVFGGIIGAVLIALIILGFLLWCLISSKCFQQPPNCNGCGGGGC